MDSMKTLMNAVVKLVHMQTTHIITGLGNCWKKQGSKYNDLTLFSNAH